MPAYYETIDGYKCDRGIVDACREAINGMGDGRVSREDVQKVYEQIADGGKETRRERWTTRYCLAEFNFTEAARDWLLDACKTLKQEDADEECEEPAAKRQKVEEADDQEKPCHEMIDGMQLDSAILHACRAAVSDGCVSLEGAKTVFEKVAGCGKVTQSERWTLRYCLTEFKWTRPAVAWMVDALKKVDHEPVVKRESNHRNSVAKAESLEHDAAEEELAAARAAHRFAIQMAEAAATRADAAEQAHKAALAQISERDSAIDRVAELAKELVDVSVKAHLSDGQPHLPLSDSLQQQAKKSD